MVVCIKPSEKDAQTETWSIYDDILDLRVPSGCRRLLAIYDREISDNRNRKCLQTPDYYRKFSYDTHTMIVYIYNVSSYRIGIYEKFTDLREHLRCCNFYDNY